MPTYLPQNIWRHILKNMTGVELTRVYGTSKNVRDAINSNTVLKNRLNKARALSTRTNAPIHTNLRKLRENLKKATSPARRKNIEKQIKIIMSERMRRIRTFLRGLMGPNAPKAIRFPQL